MEQRWMVNATIKFAISRITIRAVSAEEMGRVSAPKRRLPKQVAEGLLAAVQFTVRSIILIIENVKLK